MRLKMFAIASFAVLCAGAAYAQDWIGYTDKTEKFFVNLPSEPKVENFMFETEYGFSVPAKKYTATRGDSVYVVTVINYNSSPEYNDLKGANAHVAHLMRQSHLAGKIVFDAYGHIDKIDGHQLQINMPDGKKFFSQSVMHMQDKRLYLLEATVPANAPPPAAFQVSLQVLDDKGMVIRYNDDGVTRARGNTPAGGG